MSNRMSAGDMQVHILDLMSQQRYKSSERSQTLRAVSIETWHSLHISCCSLTSPYPSLHPLPTGLIFFFISVLSPKQLFSPLPHLTLPHPVSVLNPTEHWLRLTGRLRSVAATRGHFCAHVLFSCTIKFVILISKGTLLSSLAKRSDSTMSSLGCRSLGVHTWYTWWIRGDGICGELGNSGHFFSHQTFSIFSSPCVEDLARESLVTRLS